MKTLTASLLSLLLLAAVTPASAVTLANQCSTGDAVHGISVTDVVGFSGGASDCFGAFEGNDPGPGGSLEFDGSSWDFVSKVEDGVTEGDDIGLYYSSGDTSGLWGYNPSADFESFILVLKAANAPGWAAWLFEGDDAQSSFGTWQVAWDRDLSHLSLYAIAGEVDVPEPGTLALLGLALAGLATLAGIISLLAGPVED